VLKAILMLVSLLSLTGCLTSNVLVTVRPDGTGTIEHTTRLRPSAMTELEKLLPPEATGNPPGAVSVRPPLQTLTAPRESSAWLWGRSVRMRSTRPLNTAETIGWKTIYDFDDVTSLGVDLMPVTPGLRSFYSLAAAERRATTRLQMSVEPIADGIERLTVHFPRFAMDPSAEPPAAAVSGPAADMAALRNLLRGSRITVAIQTEGPLLRTNSPHREDHRVTLFDADLERALFSRQMTMLASSPSTFEELLSSVSVLPGVTLAREHDVTLEYQVPTAQAPAVGGPPAAPPSLETEIFLASLTAVDGKLTVGTPINITNSPGYDNQPSFTPDGREILFASGRVIRKAPSPPGLTLRDGQTDIYRYDIAARRTSRVTQTPESEYSPTVMPGRAHISVVRVELDGTQRLWSVIASGPKIELALLLADVKPVGYHAWVDERTVALYVLGERGHPATLQVADTRTGTSETVATGIGRSVQPMPSGRISFVQREHAADEVAETAMIKHLFNARPSERASISTGALVRPVANVLDPFLAWTPDGTLLMAVNSTLYRWRSGDPNWTVVANLGGFGLRNVTRLAVSPKGDRLAIVAEAR
jgi:hypothetical protein